MEYRTVPHRKRSERPQRTPEKPRETPERLRETERDRESETRRDTEDPVTPRPENARPRDPRPTDTETQTLRNLTRGPCTASDVEQRPKACRIFVAALAQTTQRVGREKPAAAAHKCCAWLRSRLYTFAMARRRGGRSSRNRCAGGRSSSL